MNNRLQQLVPAFGRLRVVVVGEAMLDSYLEGSSDRLCREAPVPVVTVEQRLNAPGGAANTAANVRALGAEVAFLSVIGQDENGEALCASLDKRGIATTHLFRDPGRQTLVKTRVTAGGQLLLRVDQGSTSPLLPPLEEVFVSHLTDLLTWADAAIVSDYGYGLLTERAIRALTASQAARPRLLAVDAKELTQYRESGISVIKPNYHEAARLLGEAPLPGAERVAHINGGIRRVLELTGSKMAAVTLDVQGAIVCAEGQEPYRTYTRSASNARASGAGDTYLSALALALAAGGSMPEAAELAAAAASVVVARDGTSACGADELLAELDGGGKYLADPAKLLPAMDVARQRGRGIVFTNGCFDLLHPGHIAFLNRAKALGDVLVVALNSDDSIRRVKGEGRPIQALADRIRLLSALSCVDHIISFDDDRPDRLIRLLQPHVFVKGGGYTRETLPEAALVEQLGGRVELLPLLDDGSTTDIIRRIRQQAA